MLEPYVLPHECEHAELASLLAGLTPRQRRVLRSYVWQVEFGELTVTMWLASPRSPSRSKWYQGHGLYWGNEAFQRALAAYRRAGLKWMTDQDQRSVELAQRRIKRASHGAAERLVEQAQGDVGALFRVVERWTDTPLPSQEIIGEEVREDADGSTHKFYQVRQAVIDLQRLSDPRYSRLIKKFSDSPRSGLSIEVYDAQRASESILDRADVGTASKATTTMELGERFEEALERAYGAGDGDQASEDPG
jgi:hypothetical protein